ncbi:MAG: hypothetical protein JST12_15555 [Armatimonadetes bacterium]|nr:hypothetical protein [Armatimonadota bacterium]MBS1703081.1 hypothetical protein [Armatimonadota bacterium]MBS1727648.1 hypothetical protein [Armatimonadota bacterium]
MIRQTWFQLVAAALILLMIAGGTWSVPVISRTFIFFSGACLVLAIGAGIRKIRERDKYDLNVLREMVIEGTFDEENVPDIPEDADIYCMYCNQVYGAHLKVCPRCGR